MANAFIVESYVPGGTEADFRRGTAELHRHLDRAGLAQVELVHAAYVPSDQSAYWIVRAGSTRSVVEAWGAAGVAADRVLAVVVLDPAAPPGGS